MSSLWFWPAGSACLLLQEEMHWQEAKLFPQKHATHSIQWKAEAGWTGPMATVARNHGPSVPVLCCSAWWQQDIRQRKIWGIKETGSKHRQHDAACNLLLLLLLHRSLRAFKAQLKVMCWILKHVYANPSIHIFSTSEMTVWGNACLTAEIGTVHMIHIWREWRVVSFLKYTIAEVS